ncbi:MAG: hypothetical protein SF052_01870 [Bacteroidia bacterium]|nr:hypothetical protein [Bacteroidia bacterium]
MYSDTTRLHYSWWLSHKAVIIPVLLNFILATILSYVLPLRSDEGYTLSTISDGFLLAIKRAVIFENYPPFYFGAVSLWNLSGDSYFWGRMFSVFSILGAAILIPSIGKRYLPKVSPIWLVSVFLFNPSVVLLEVDMRCYAFLIFLSALEMLFFYEGYLSATPDRKSRWYYILVAVIGLYTHYFAGFLLAANGVVLLFTLNGKLIRNYILDMIIPAVALGAIVSFIPGQFQNQHYVSESHTLLGTLVFITKTVGDYFLSTDYVTIQPKFIEVMVRMIPIGIMILALGINFRELKHAFNGPERHILIVFCSLLLLFAGVYFLFGKSIILPRYMVAMTIPIVFIFFYTLSLNGSSSWMVPVGGSILLVLYIIISPIQFFPPIKTEDYKAVSAFLEEKEQPGEAILIFENIHELVLKHHYKGINVLYQFPLEINMNEAWNHKKWAIKNPEQVEQFFTEKVNHPEVFWLITHEKESINQVQLNQHYLEDFLSKNYNTIEDQHFRYTIRVRYLQKKH